MIILFNIMDQIDLWRCGSNWLVMYIELTEWAWNEMSGTYHEKSHIPNLESVSIQ